MLKNFLTIAWRRIRRDKLHSVINIVGLAIGVSACFVICLIVNYELSFNKRMRDSARIYRIHSSFSGAFTGINRGVPTAAKTLVGDQFKGIESVVSFHEFSASVHIPEKEKKEFERQNKIILTEPSFFQVFSSYQWVIGSADVLAKPFQVVLTESQAKLYFGTSDPEVILGRVIIYRDSLSTTVAGIVKDLPFNTDIDMHDFISFSTIEKSWLKNSIELDNWSSTNSSSQLFILTEKSTGIEKLTSQLSLLANEYKKHSDWKNNFGIQPFSDIHFNIQTGIFSHSRQPVNKSTLYILSTIAILLLIIAAINFVNLETAQAVRRAREVGIRKTLGSTRKSLITQFLYQSFIITFISTLLALPLTEAALSFFSEFIPAGMSFSLTEIIPFAVLIIFLIGLLAGLYPAFVLSSATPASALKNIAYLNTSSSGHFRKTLIVFQFSIAQILIIAALVVGWQVNYMLDKDIGFKKDAVINFYTPWTEEVSKTAVLKNELLKLSEITDLSLSAQPPAEDGWTSNTIEYQSNQGDIISANAFRKFGDTEYIPFYKMKILAGRNFNPTDSLREFVINKTLMNQLSFAKPEDAIGQILKYENKEYPISGVVEDFHIQSLHKKVEPVILGIDAESSCFNIRLSTAKGSNDFNKGLENIEKEWRKVYPNTPFEYSFLDEKLKNFYQSERNTSKLVQTATGLAIFISCLGLFGLASFTTTQRTKEIGIRKVLGASVHAIVILLSKEFLVLVLIAFFLALPLAWYAVNQWLDNFAYHMNLNAWVFVITALTGMGLAFVTVAYQTMKAAARNPVDSLKNE